MRRASNEVASVARDALACCHCKQWLWCQRGLVGAGVGAGYPSRRVGCGIPQPWRPLSAAAAGTATQHEDGRLDVRFPPVGASPPGQAASAEMTAPDAHQVVQGVQQDAFPFAVDPSRKVWLLSAGAKLAAKKIQVPEIYDL